MPELSQNFQPNLEQSLQLHLSPQMLAMLKVLQLPYHDLLVEIDKASEENPFVEIEKPDALVEYIRYLGSDKKLKKQVDFDAYPGLENVKSLPRDLISHLLEQLQLEDLGAPLPAIGEFLIENIDSSGYFKNYEEIKSEAVAKLSVTPQQVDQALSVIQGFEPDGVGARDLKECLLIQVREYNFEDIELEEVLEEALRKHLDQIAKKEYKAVAQAMDISEAGVMEIAEFIRENLTPAPASEFGEEIRQVVPSFAVEKEDGKLKLINLEERYGPKITLSREYDRMLRDKKTDAETVKFLKDKLVKAKELMENLLKRGETSKRIVDIILEVQKDFVETGAKKLKPLLQRDLADRLGVHPSTISRAVAGKFIQTPKGVFPLKFLCPRELGGATSVSIKARLVDIMKGEDKRQTLSDDDLVKKLSQEGIVIGRRTVSNYRTALGLRPSAERQEP
jgi:RNA polymerase sigma-54 factor